MPGNDDDALVFVLVDQEPADGVAPELQHAPAHHAAEVDDKNGERG